MGLYEFSSFVVILRESIKVLAKNGQFMATITTVSILLNSLLLFINIFSTKPVIHDLLSKETLLLLAGPGSPGFADLLLGVKIDVRTIIGIESATLLASLIISLFSMVSTILVSAIAYQDKALSFNDFLSRLTRSCVRPFITSFHITIYLLGYYFFVLVLLIPLVVFCDHPFTLKAISISFGIVALIFWTYLSVVWVLALVISVLEENCYGIGALGKAGGLIKGKRLHGFALNFFVLLASIVVVQCSRMIRDPKSLSTQMIIGFFLTVFSGLVTMFHYLTYTVLYFQCKKTHGEEIELQASMEYSKVLVTEDIP
ncbi:hypothetical protein ACSBR1_022832 [Camellia fascicularis]